MHPTRLVESRVQYSVVCMIVTSSIRRIMLALGALLVTSPGALAQIHRLDWNRGYDAHDLEFLKRPLANRTVVQLGESIHLTDEFPRVRLSLVRYLHEELGFDVLALEGSAVDSWIAQDHLYRSQDPIPKKSQEAQKLAWFGLWQTQAMGEVMKYVATTQTESQRPLYLTSFDSQPGSSNAFLSDGLKSLSAFLEAVKVYVPPPDSGAFERWENAFQPYLSNCFQSTVPRTEEQRRVMDRSLAELNAWLRQASTRVRPPVHGRALLAVIASLHGSFDLCGTAPARPFGGQTYQRARDRENALTVLSIQDNVSASGKIILWAHHSHVNHDSLGTSVPSMGRSLLEILGRKLYTIGLFAASGEALSAADSDDLVLKRLRPASGFEIEDALKRLANFDYFLDLASPGLPAAFGRAATGRFDTDESRSYVLDRDFSAAILIQQVHPPVLAFKP